MLKKYVRSRNVYENKQISDNVPGKKSDIYVLDSDISYKRSRILQNFAETAGLFVGFRPLGNELLSSKCANLEARASRPYRPAYGTPWPK
jgi:hypothetical protein